MDSGLLFGLGLLLVLALIYIFFYRSRKLDFNTVVKKISSEYRKNIVIPDGLDGFIEIEHFLLSSSGLLVIDYREASGTIFPGENLEQWPIMHEGKRSSFNNPYQRMKNSVTALSQLVSNVPITGLLVFPDTVNFGNKPPENVITVSELYKRYHSKDVNNTDQLISSFRQYYNDVCSYIEREAN